MIEYVCIVSVPPAPGDFRLSLVPGEATMLVARWLVPTPTNGVILNYTITCQPAVSVTLPAEVSPPGSEVTTNLTVLSAYTEYSCSVVARTNAGTGNSSNTDVERTDEAGKGSSM